MNALIAMAVYDTEENKRTALTEKTLESIALTVNPRHRLFLIDNGSCEKTKTLLRDFANDNLSVELITSAVNIGTAKAINCAWRNRNPGEHLIKMDNDVVIHSSGWVDDLIQAIEKDPMIGILGLKRKDLWEDPNKPVDHPYRSTLRMLDHSPGERWIVVEDVRHVMGTCQMYNYRLIDIIGGLYQMGGLYGFDDSLAGIRCTLAGYKNCFLPHIEIDHIDPGGDSYTQWKSAYAGKMMSKYNDARTQLLNKTLPIHFPL